MEQTVVNLMTLQKFKYKAMVSWKYVLWRISEPVALSVKMGRIYKVSACLIFIRFAVIPVL